MKKKLLLFLILTPLLSFSQLSVKSVHSSHGQIGFYQFTPAGYNPDSTYKYPVIIFLHGVGERGNGTTDLPMVLNQSLPKMIAAGASMTFTVQGKKHAFIVLMPQMTKEYINWQNFYVEAMIDYAKANLKIDPNKIFLAGWSLGGGGAWKFPTASVDSANLIAGIVPVAPAPDYTNLCNISRGRVAVWAHHSRDDSSVPIRYTKDAVTGINNCSPEIPARMTYYGKGKHTLVSIIAFDTVNTYQYPNMFQWMIGISRENRKATNAYPVANAGNDTTVFLPSLNAVLNGSRSFDPNDVIVAYSWRLVSGPVSPDLHILRKDFPVTSVSGLEPGTYTFRLIVVDAFGFTTADDVVLKVILPTNGKNATPYVYAGKNQTTTYDNVYLKGEIRDFDGKINGSEWRQISGPARVNIIARNEKADLFGLVKEGQYLFELKAWDNSHPAGISRDTVMVTRKASIPIAVVYWIKGLPAEKNYLKSAILGLLVLVIAIISIFYFQHIKNRYFRVSGFKATVDDNFWARFRTLNIL